MSPLVLASVPAALALVAPVGPPPDAVPVPEDSPPGGVTTTVETSGTSGGSTTSETVGPGTTSTSTTTIGPAPGEVIGPPYGSRAGVHREGEVWRPINPPVYDKQPVPSEAAVNSQSNPELSDALKARRALPPVESPQRFALEVKFGPYLPDVDKNYTGSGFGPYAKVFGETDDDGRTIGAPKQSFYGGIAFEWQITKKLAGPIGIGVQWSMFRDSAQAPLAEPPAEGDQRSAADKVRFTVMPFAFQAVYRFELLADKVRFAPFVPYVKAGVAYAFWWAKNGNGDIATVKRPDGSLDKGRGGVWGWQLNLGGMLRLDFLERGTARRFDRTSGINHTYVFAEWQLARLNNFGRKGSMNVGDSTYMIGLAMEF